ncbi:GTPase Era [Mycoplasmopsis lipofaciens]|uniref:GTPase Era n=1 Tax=Mycoplasmopsis lipofaciens TaxID=114884 RepID=UPI000489B89C|nr:GTPase Era [Mycoplasmopsis lipofaciens]
MKVCIASIIGRPNVGKSSMLNSILSYNVSIVSNVPQTTRDQIIGIYNEEDVQIVFQDTPGIHKPLNLLGESLNKNAFDSIKETDCVLFLTPINEEIAEGDKLILEKIQNHPNKIAIITKMDLNTNIENVAKKIKDLENFYFKNIISFSTKNPKTWKDLINVVKQFSYEGEPYYDPDYITDKSMRFIAKEIIRESAINLLREELPHSIAIEISDFIEEEDQININAIIYVKKPSQKGMLIGKNGSMIKQIGTIARKKLIEQFGTKVILNNKVKIAEKWVNDNKKLKKFGY